MDAAEAERLLRQIVASAPAPRRARSRAPGRGLAGLRRAGLLAAGLGLTAAAVTVAVVLSSGTTPAPSAGTTPVPRGPRATAHAVPSGRSARQVLLAYATAAARAPATTGKYWYVHATFLSGFPDTFDTWMLRNGANWVRAYKTHNRVIRLPWAGPGWELEGSPLFALQFKVGKPPAKPGPKWPGQVTFGQLQRLPAAPAALKAWIVAFDRAFNESMGGTPVYPGEGVFVCLTSLIADLPGSAAGARRGLSRAGHPPEHPPGRRRQGPAVRPGQARVRHPRRRARDLGAPRHSHHVQPGRPSTQAVGDRPLGEPAPASEPHPPVRRSLMRSRRPRPPAPVSGPARWPGTWQPGAGAALAAAAVLALAGLAPPASAASSVRPATAAALRLKSLATAGPAASATSVTGGNLTRPGSGAALWEQADGHRYTVPDVAAPHSRWAAASRAEAAARPGRARATLRLKVTNLAGKPGRNVQVVLMNTDNARLSPAPLSVNGTARITVPAGDYSLFALFVDFNAKGSAAVAFHCVFRSDFRVTAAGTTVTIPERSATSPISVSTPRQAGGTELETVFFRGSKAGGGTATGLILTPPEMLPTYISPQPAAKVGQLRYLERWSGAASSGRYWYDAAFGFPGIPPSEHFVVRGSQVATIHEHFFADALAPSIGQGLWMEDPCEPATGCGGYSNVVPLVSFSAPQVVDMPGNLTVYLDTACGDQWVSAVQTTNYAFCSPTRKRSWPGTATRWTGRTGRSPPALASTAGPGSARPAPRAAPCR